MSTHSFGSDLDFNWDTTLPFPTNRALNPEECNTASALRTLMPRTSGIGFEVLGFDSCLLGEIVSV